MVLNTQFNVKSGALCLIGVSLVFPIAAAMHPWHACTAPLLVQVGVVGAALDSKWTVFYAFRGGDYGMFFWKDLPQTEGRRDADPLI